MNCYKCHHANLHGSNFCEKCGTDLKAPPPPSRVPPVRSYGGYNPNSPANYSPPSHRSPAPRPVPAPRPSPAGSGYSPPPPVAPVPPTYEPAPQVQAPPAVPHPAPQAAPPKQPPKRRRSPIVSERSDAPTSPTPAATPRREPLPFGQLVGANGQNFPLRYDVNLVGRESAVEGIAPQVDLTTADVSGTVSRKHARIGKDDSSVFIEDLGSSNGTRHNGQPLRVGMQAPLTDGDQIVFGDIVFTFHLISKNS